MMMTCLCVACLSFLGVSVYSGLRAMLSVRVSRCLCLSVCRTLSTLAFPPQFSGIVAAFGLACLEGCGDVAELGGGDNQKKRWCWRCPCVCRSFLSCVCVCVCIAAFGHGRSFCFCGSVSEIPPGRDAPSCLCLCMIERALCSPRTPSRHLSLPVYVCE